MPVSSWWLRVTVQSRGFTLVELLIVIALLALMSALLTPMLLPSPGRTISQVSTEISLRLRELRRHARSARKHRRFLVDTQTRRYRADSTSSWHALPEGMTVELTTADSLLRSAETGSIDFYPDGSSSGGRILLGLEGHTARIDIEWLTGRIRISEESL